MGVFSLTLLFFFLFAILNLFGLGMISVYILKDGKGVVVNEDVLSSVRPVHDENGVE